MTGAEPQPPPLAGIRVIDLTHVLAGPFCTQLLAESGADVIKVEPPGGEYSRIRGPQRRGANGTLSSYSAAVNRGKRSLEIDLKAPAGRDLFLRLVAKADVVVDNFSPGALERLGLASATLRARDPRLVTASITLWGVDARHELARRGGVAMVAEAESTVMHYRRELDGAPMHIGFPLGDLSSGIACYAAIVTALIERERTGRGRQINIGLVQNLLAMNATNITKVQIASGPRAGFAGFGFFRSSDGWIALGVNSDSLWARMCEAMDRPDLATDPRYACYLERDQRVAEVNALISAWAGRQTSAELVRRISGRGVPVGALARPGETLQNEDFLRLSFLVAVDDGLGGTITVPSSPLGFNSARRRVPQPREGAADVYREVLGLEATAVAELEAAGAFGSSDAKEAVAP
jgi:crotonobetainyl-CoA:carnitine CoA-transferase CaiB-like acyl-CoA transferase